jgi:hypothetical protein
MKNFITSSKDTDNRKAEKFIRGLSLLEAEDLINYYDNTTCSLEDVGYGREALETISNSLTFKRIYTLIKHCK